MSKKRIAAVAGTLGAAALATVMAAPAAMASATGSSYYAGIYVNGSGLHVNYIDAFAAMGPDTGAPEFYGHFQITANGVTLANSDTGWYPHGVGIQLNWNGNMADQTQVCVTAWQYSDHWYSNGKACVTVHS